MNPVETFKWIATIVQGIGVMYLIFSNPLIGCLICLAPSIFFMFYFINIKDYPIAVVQLFYVLANCIGIGINL